jgi:outer membrane protein assembly factor BamB
MRGRLVAAVAVAAALAACTGSSVPFEPNGPPTATTPAATGTTGSEQPGQRPVWPTYHGDNQRTGVSTSDPLQQPLREAWSAGLDGAVYAQPLVIGDAVVVATENNSVYALDAASGEIRWRRHLGEPVPLSDLPCGNIDPLGITGTPVYDEKTGDVFLVTETAGVQHTLWAIDVRTGRPQWDRSLDVVDSRDPDAEQQRSALLLAGDRVYVAFGGLFGDCGNYVGYVAGVATDGNGAVLHYEVPTTREAGMWSPAGPVLDESGRHIYVASGNGEQVDGDYDGSDSVIRLSLDLRRTAFFAPDTWPEDNAADLDLGSSSPVLVGDKVVIAGKRGTVYLLDADDLGGIGGELSSLDGCAAYGGAARSSADGGVILPCVDGIRALDVTGNRMSWEWQADVAGSPAVAQDVVYSLDLDAGALVQIDLESGKELGRVDVGAVSRFSTPVPVGSRVYVGTIDGVVAVRGSA